MKDTLLVMIFGLSLFACDGNYKEAVINGRVTDSVTGKPISGSVVHVTCWVYDMTIWESRTVVRDTLSDADGFFQFSFEKGEAIDIEVRHPDYLPYVYSKTLKGNTHKARLNLSKAP